VGDFRLNKHKPVNNSGVSVAGFRDWPRNKSTDNPVTKDAVADPGVIQETPEYQVVGLLVGDDTKEKVSPREAIGRLFG
jgi:hypothetical protein